MYNEHSVCEREISDLKEDVEYYKTLHQNEYEARQRLCEEVEKCKKALEEMECPKCGNKDLVEWTEQKIIIERSVKTGKLIEIKQTGISAPYFYKCHCGWWNEGDLK